MSSPTVENYVKAIFSLGRNVRNVTTGELAGHMRVSPGTVTSMLKSLSESGLIDYIPYEGARLTEAGLKLALSVTRRHRLAELFLHQVLGYAWDEVHAEADELEHTMSEKFVARIDALLHHPMFDPHGDPIPSTEGLLPPQKGVPLTECVVGTRFQLTRVVDQSDEFLRNLTAAALTLGAEGSVVANEGQTATITISVAGREVAFERESAAALLVDIVSTSLGLPVAASDSSEGGSMVDSPQNLSTK